MDSHTHNLIQFLPSTLTKASAPGCSNVHNSTTYAEKQKTKPTTRSWHLWDLFSSIGQQAMCILILGCKDISLFITTWAINTSRSLIWFDQGWSHLTKCWQKSGLWQTSSRAVQGSPAWCSVHTFVGGLQAFQKSTRFWPYVEAHFRWDRAHSGWYSHRLEAHFRTSSRYKMLLHWIIAKLEVRQSRLRQTQRTWMLPQTRRAEPPNPTLQHQTSHPMTTSPMGFLVASTVCHEKALRDRQICHWPILTLTVTFWIVQKHSCRDILNRESFTVELNRRRRRAQMRNTSKDYFNSLSLI